MTERKRLTDRQFFTSQTVKNRFETMVNTQARRCNCPVIVEIIYDGKQPDLGWSGFGGFILINAGHAVLAPAGRNRALRYELCYAVLSHELGHVMYSDVILMEHMLGRMRSGKPESVLMLPECEEEERRYAEEIIRRAGDDLSHEAAAFLLQEISNCVEDGYIEKRLGREYEGGSVGISLELMREYMKAMESGGSVQGDGTDLLRQALAVLHSLCVYGGDIHGFPGTEGLRTSCGPLIEEALGTDAPDARWKYAVRIFLGLWGCFDPDELIPMAEKYYAERASERKDGAPLNVRFSADRLFDNDVRTLNRSALEEFLELDEERGRKGESETGGNDRGLPRAEQEEHHKADEEVQHNG